MAPAGEPRFSFRGWETQVDGLWCEPRGGSSFWYKNEFYLKYLDHVLQEAPRYNTNALILMGRHNRGEVHTFISYRNWPLLHAIYKDRGRADRELQIKTLNELIAKAKKQGVDVFIWTHELHLPPELATKYPATAGVGTRFCPSSPELWRFVSSKYEEFFDRVPGLAGMFLVLSETQFNLLQGSPCRCERCRAVPAEQHLERVIRAVAEPLGKRGKRLVVRTFGHSVDECRRICMAVNRLPSDLKFAVMSKSTAQDFVGLRYPDHPAFELIKGRPQFLEDAFGEFRGKTNVIVTPATFYRDRIRHAAARGVQGIVLRLDHNGYAKSNFETPNEFNIYFTSRLWSTPEADPDEIWNEWFNARYGSAPAGLIRAFKNTESIWEHGTNTLGVYTVSAHGNLAPLFWGSYSAWDNMNASISRITKGRSDWDRLGQELLHPTDTTIARIQEEIDEANRLADETLALVRRASADLRDDDRNELLHYFGVLRDAVRVFGHLKMLFFLGLQAEQSDGDLRSERIAAALRQSQQALHVARHIEQRHGADYWPLVPDDGRGAPFYDILEGYWSDSIASILAGQPPRKGGWGKPICTPLAAARLWRAILESSRPNRSRPVGLLEFQLDDRFQELLFSGSTVTLKSPSGPDLVWPVGKTVQGPRLIHGVTYRVSFEDRPECVRVIAVPRPDLNTSLRAYQRRQLARDQQLRDAISTLDDLKAYQSKVRENLCRILGPWPERTPLRPRVTGILDRDGYRIEKVLIQSQPGFYVPINLYVPTAYKAPMPAVLSPLGHAPAGKAHHVKDNYQARFITLARKGYVVCAYDPLGQGERAPYGAKTGNHHYIQGYQCMPSGRHLAQYFIWDGIRCLDYLESRPEVDKKRIACAGCSGGGAMTNYIAALDQRVAVAVPASWITDSITLTEDSGLHTESWFPDMCAPYGPGTRQLLACIAPRPLLILGNRDDREFPPDRMEAVYRDLRKLYRQVGAEDRIQYVSVPTPHGFWPEARRELYRFLNTWFHKEDAGIDEPVLSPEKESDLFCAPGGQVGNLPNAQTVFSLNQAVMAKLQRQRANRRQTLSPDDYREFVRKGIIAATCYRPTSAPVAVFNIAESCSPTTCAVKQLILEYEPGFYVKGDLYDGKNAMNLAAVILIAEDNTRAIEVANRLQQAGFRVLHMHTTTTHDRRAIMGGKPRCGRWLKLLVRGADYLRAQTAPESVKVVALGIGPSAALAAQFAGIVEPDRFAAVVALGGLDRIESLSEGIAESHSLQMLPGMLRWFDEVDLAAALAPKPLLIAGVSDKHGHLLSSAQIDRRYAWPHTRYAGAQAAEALRLIPGKPSVETLVRWLDNVANSVHK